MKTLIFKLPFTWFKIKAFLYDLTIILTPVASLIKSLDELGSAI